MLAEFMRHFGLDFKDLALLKQALTHRSYLSVTGGHASESNERLEFLGDSVLGLVTSEQLFRTRPGEHEGQLTKTKSLLVSKAIISRRALAMGLGKFVLMSHSEIDSGGRQRLSILADAFESVIGAVYLDLGFEAARQFIDRWLLKDSSVIVADKRHVNYKSHLQEFVQSTFRTHPVYRIRSEVGPDHSKHFMVEVSAGRRVLGEGRGKNKKEAEQAAARQALDRVSESGRESRSGRERQEGDRNTGREPRDRNEPRESREPRDRNEPRESRESREPRDRNEPRESREPRDRNEPRDRDAGRREAQPPEARAVVVEAPAEADAATEVEGEGPRRGRRRGRRGGRGRRRPEDRAPVTGTTDDAHANPVDETQGTATPAPAAPERPAAPRGPEREARFERRRESREPRPRFERPRELERPREIEPLPPATAEDDIEEIGRPEGPPGERFMDPFATENPKRMEPRRDSFALPREPMPEPEETRPLDTSDDPWSEAQESEDAATGTMEEKQPETGESARRERGNRAVYGRRRGRRN